MRDTDTHNHFPIKNAFVPPSSNKMEKFHTLPEEQQKFFQIDEWFSEYRSNKLRCLKESVPKHYQKTGDFDVGPINLYIIERLTGEYPEHFTKTMLRERVFQLDCKLTGNTHYFDILGRRLPGGPDISVEQDTAVDGFDALAREVPEDLVVVALNRESGKDRTTHAHLCSASGWSAEWAAGKSFGEIHDGVRKANGKHVIKAPEKMVKGILMLPEPIQRVGAMSFRPNTELCRHPDNPDKAKWPWQPGGEHNGLFLRFERQTVTPFPGLGAFLFTIRTYYNDLTRGDRIDQAIEALQNVDEDAYPREALKKHGSSMLEFLKKQRLQENG